MSKRAKRIRGGGIRVEMLFIEWAAEGAPKERSSRLRREGIRQLPGM
ncbi:hypothetical protein HMPREF0762_00962 [Slackia exigua ATCC 700122]|uniref:Uncharacterized protein n=1 Tax=Slackia exigua (strain ATCC 700122 / DSM 15923 / CIP 105133 / JCM 11022 / KCTC 5966 / S-7) TaxID=649764 RepID=D0WGK8_SLAES|nr:hypothetical protein HMPREF0762_00962 [Slackia exigua ATCC 700122]